MVDRFNFTAMFYPFNYGFIPGTKAEDGDPTDVLVISSYSVAPGTVIPSRPIGMLEMEDEEGIDTKLIAVPIEKVDPIFGAWQDSSDIPAHTKLMIKHFFDHYKDLEPGKFVKTGKFLDRESAEKVLLADMKRGG